MIHLRLVVVRYIMLILNNRLVRHLVMVTSNMTVWQVCQVLTIWLGLGLTIM